MHPYICTDRTYPVLPEHNCALDPHHSLDLSPSCIRQSQFAPLTKPILALNLCLLETFLVQLRRVIYVSLRIIEFACCNTIYLAD